MTATAQCSASNKGRNRSSGEASCLKPACTRAYAWRNPLMRTVRLACDAADVTSASKLPSVALRAEADELVVDIEAERPAATTVVAQSALRAEQLPDGRFDLGHPAKRCHVE